MRISRDTLRRTRKEEGWVPKPYTGPQGYRLVGFGHSIETGPKFDFLEGRDWDSAPLTEDEGEKVLSGDLEVIGRELEHHWPAVKDIPGRGATGDAQGGVPVGRRNPHEVQEDEGRFGAWRLRGGGR